MVMVNGNGKLEIINEWYISFKFVATMFIVLGNGNGVALK